MTTRSHTNSGKQVSRRSFLTSCAATGVMMAGFGTFLQSCAEKEIVLTGNLASAYLDGVISIIDTILERERENIQRAATMAVQAKLQGHLLFSAFGGPIFPGDITRDRPGSPDLFITENVQRAAKDDILLTNNPEVARGLSEQYVKVIGITTPKVPTLSSEPGTYENMGVLLIEDVAEVVIYSHMPYTDGILKVEGVDVPMCPASGVIHSMLYYAVSAEIVEGYTQSGIYPVIG